MESEGSSPHSQKPATCPYPTHYSHKAYSQTQISDYDEKLEQLVRSENVISYIPQNMKYFLALYDPVLDRNFV
jgi:hypothetical protein